jgi:eukaryotic-like serine/threonine-protein kinase
VTGRRIGPYQLLDVLGEGGIGQVYAGRDTVLGRQVAIKMLRPELSRDRSFITRFYNEAQNLGDLGHANITTLYALHLEGQEPFMVMELVHGHTLEMLLGRVHRVPLRESLAVVAQAVAGLAFAHRRGIVHRDIKPSNLMVTDTGVLKIMDFGIARVRGTQRLTRAGQMFGTLLYASPEQIRGSDVDERSDLYSLAVVLYEMLAGSPPFTAENEHALMTSHLQVPPPPLTPRVGDLAPQVEPALMRALAKKPEERFASVEEFGHAIGAVAIRGDASDILQDFVAPIFRETPARTRLVNTPGEIGLQPAKRGRERNFGADHRSLPPRRGLRVPWPGALAGGLRVPIAVFGVVAFASALSLGYLAFWPKGTVPPSQIALTETAKLAPQTPPQPSTAPSRPAVTTAAEPASSTPSPQQSPPVPPAAASTSAAEPPSAPPPQEPATPSPPSDDQQASLAPTPVILPPSGATTKDTTWLDLKPASRPPRSNEAEPTAANPEPTPQPKPDIHGSVSAVESSSRIRVGEQWLNLYGINDPTQRAHTRDVLAYLQPSRGVVECYEKAGGRYQCYADGKDLALLALRDGLARAAGDAPSEYRSVTSQPKSARH